MGAGWTEYHVRFSQFFGKFCNAHKNIFPRVRHASLAGKYLNNFLKRLRNFSMSSSSKLKLGRLLLLFPSN